MAVAEWEWVALAAARVAWVAGLAPAEAAASPVQAEPEWEWVVLAVARPAVLAPAAVVASPAPAEVAGRAVLVGQVAPAAAVEPVERHRRRAPLARIASLIDFAAKADA